MALIEKKTAKQYKCKLRKNQAGQFMQTSTKDPNVKYLIGDLLDETASQGYGIQTRRIVACFFVGTMIGDAMVEDVTALVQNQDPNAPFDGELPKNVFGNFYDVPLGARYKTTFTPAGRTEAVEAEVTTISVFIADGDDPVKVAMRAVKNFKNDRSNELIDEADQSTVDEASAAAAANAAANAASI